MKYYFPESVNKLYFLVQTGSSLTKYLGTCIKLRIEAILPYSEKNSSLVPLVTLPSLHSIKYVLKYVAEPETEQGPVFGRSDISQKWIHYPNLNEEKGKSIQ